MARSHPKHMLVRIITECWSECGEILAQEYHYNVHVLDNRCCRSSTDKRQVPGYEPSFGTAFSKIEKGAEERLEALWSKKERMEAGEVSTETVPKLIGHMEKVEKEDVDEEGEQIEGDDPAVEKEVGGGLTADREATVAGGAQGEQMTEHMDTNKSAKSTKKVEASGTLRIKRRSTPSIGRMKEERKRARVKEQEQRWREATATGLGEIPTGELDLEDAMLSPEEGDKQQTLGKDKTDEGRLRQGVHQNPREKGKTKSNEVRKKRTGGGA